MERIRASRRQPAPPNTKRVTRPARWSNPYVLIEHGGEHTRASSRDAYRRDLAGHEDAVRAELGGYDYLSCYCPLDVSWCHADDLVAVCNGARVDELA